jgi:hypothetical protein
MDNSNDIIKSAYISNDVELMMDNVEFNSNYLSKKVKKLSSVEKLIIIKSNLEEVTFFPPNLKILKIVNCTLSNIEMDSAPESLTKISLENNNLDFFIITPNLNNLVELNLSYNNLSEIPYINSSLKKLNLEGNVIEEINSNLKDSILEDLNLGMNCIEILENIPISIINLNISNNKFKHLDLSTLINLKKIIASYNEIEFIHNNLPDFLTHIDFSYNNLKSLPQFLTLNYIEYINLKSNTNLNIDEANFELITRCTKNDRNDSNDGENSNDSNDSDDSDTIYDTLDEITYDTSDNNTDNTDNNSTDNNSSDNIDKGVSKIYIKLKRIYEV